MNDPHYHRTTRDLPEAPVPFAVAPGAMRPRAEDERVDHPSHYGGADDPYEVIKVLEAWLSPEELRGFCLGNVIKYLARAGKKGDPEVDRRKAGWYLRRYLERTS